MKKFLIISIVKIPLTLGALITNWRKWRTRTKDYKNKNLRESWELTKLYIIEDIKREATHPFTWVSIAIIAIVIFLLFIFF
jgi:hypothetical protein